MSYDERHAHLVAQASQVICAVAGMPVRYISRNRYKRRKSVMALSKMGAISISFCLLKRMPFVFRSVDIRIKS
jgi:hypothetical protein